MPNYKSELWLDGGGRHLKSKIAGEDLTKDVMKVEQRFSYFSLTSLVTVTVKTGAGFLHAITISANSTPTVEIYDNTAASGTLIGRICANVPPGTYAFNANFSTGLTLNPQPAGILPTLTASYN